MLVSVILTAIIVSLPWAYIRTQQQHLHTSTVSSHDALIKSLQQQIEQQSRINQQLVENFSKAQEQRLHAETRLAGVETQLSSTEETLSSLNEMDWKSKYDLAMIDNELLIEKIAELEFQH
ncbi:MAG: hypothetical protein V3V89_06055, partial [Gammaproteobacteria bacterium]